MLRRRIEHRRCCPLLHAALPGPTSKRTRGDSPSPLTHCSAACRRHIGARRRSRPPHPAGISWVVCANSLAGRKQTSSHPIFIIIFHIVIDAPRPGNRSHCKKIGHCSFSERGGWISPAAFSAITRRIEQYASGPRRRWSTRPARRACVRGRLASCGEGLPGRSPDVPDRPARACLVRGWL